MCAGNTESPSTSDNVFAVGASFFFAKMQVCAEKLPTVPVEFEAPRCVHRVEIMRYAHVPARSRVLDHDKRRVASKSRREYTLGRVH